MSTRKFVGETLKKDVIDQLKIREELLGNPQTNPDNYIRYKSGNNAWIRAISGVNVRDEGTDTYTSNKAKNFILSGGELFWDNNTKTFKKREGFNTNLTDSRGRYNFDPVLGVRPEGGITNFSVQHINRFGTVRKAELQFNVWTLADLDKAQEIYFRPGMSIIVEWGNSSYISNDNNFIDLASPSDTQKFFEGFKVGSGNLNTSSQIDSVIEKNIEDSNYNYDGFIGLISNFSWSLRPDGGYDCSLTIVSKGSILSSLTVLNGQDAITNKIFTQIPDKFFTKKPLPEPAPETEEEEQPGLLGSTFNSAKQLWGRLTGDPDTSSPPGDTDIESKERLSLLHFFCSKVEEIDIHELEEGYITYSNFENSVFSNQGLTRSEQVKDKYFTVKEPNPLIPFLKEELGEDDYNFRVFGFDGKVDKESAKFRYVSLRTFLALVNMAFLNGSKDKLLPSFNLDIERYGEYETFKNHFSLDPSSVTLPKSPQQLQLQAPKQTVAGWIGKGLLLTGNTIPGNLALNAIFRALLKNASSETVPVSDILVNNVTDNIKKSLDVGTGIRIGTSLENNILNIYISTRFIIRKLDALYQRNAIPEKLDLISFLTSVLTEINTSLGGITDLDVSFTAGKDEEFAFIIDRAKINPNLNQDNVEEINIRGLKNTVTSLDLKTYISNELGSQIAISATGGSENNINSNLGLIKYNEGKRDRFRVNYRKLTEDEIKDLSPQRQEEINKQIDEDLNSEFKKIVDSKKKFDKFIINVADAYAKFNNTIFGDGQNSKYRTSLFAKIKGEGISRTKAVLSKKYQNSDDEPQNVLPLELSFTMSGISGLTVGEVFKFKTPSQVLPAQYDDFGFIIVGLDSTIENNKWFTTVRANLFRLPKKSTEKKVKEILEEYTHYI